MTPSWRRRSSSSTCIGRQRNSRGSTSAGRGAFDRADRGSPRRNRGGGADCLRRAMPELRSSRFARPRIAIASSRRQAPTGSMLTDASLASGRLASARSASSCSPAGVAASVSAVHLRRKNRIRRDQPRQRNEQDRRRGDGDAEHDRQPGRGGVQAVARPRRCRAPPGSPPATVCSARRRTAESRGAVTGGVQISRDARGAVVDLPAHVGDRVDTAVCTASPTNTHAKDHSDDDDIAGQLCEQAAGGGGVRARSESSCR